MNNKIDITSLILQALSLQILFQDYNNVDLMEELQRQDKFYLKTIIEQNEQIINLLMEGRNINARQDSKKSRR